MFGLTIGLSVAFAIYINDRGPGISVTPVAEQPSNVDDNNEQASAEPEPPHESRFDFYSMLPNFEVIIPEQEPDVRADSGHQAVVDPQAGTVASGSTHSRYRPRP